MHSILFKAVVGLYLGIACASQLCDDKVSNRLDADVRSALCGDFKEGLSVILDFTEKVNWNSFDIPPGTSRAHKRHAAFQHLNAHSENQQVCVRKEATRLSLNHKSYWITNAMFIERITLYHLESLTNACPHVGFRVREDKMRKRNAPVVSRSKPNEDELTSSVAWNIAKINAPDVWSLGYNGTGVTIATIDGGVEYDHVALKYNYRGATVNGKDIEYDHDYNWQDWAYGSDVPSDSDGHGTNVQGIAAASQSSGVGVAVGSSWISAKVFNYAGYAADSWILEAAQWVQCPTPVNDLQAKERCDLGADVVSCSWGFDDPRSSFDFTESWVKAGMVPVFAVGNFGPDCNSVVAPSTFEGVIGVGGTDKKDTIVGWSSRGPGPSSNGYSLLTPAVVAPGLSILGPDYESTSSYTAFSGTSQACPHLAGVSALLLSADPSLSTEDIYNLITSTAERSALPEPDTGDTSCGGKQWDDFPNYIYGAGRVDALAAMNALIKGNF